MLSGQGDVCLENGASVGLVSVSAVLSIIINTNTDASPLRYHIYLTYGILISGPRHSSLD